MITCTTKPVDLSKYNGFITVKNPKTGQHRTFRIHTYKHGVLKGNRAVGLLIGSNNQSDYKDFGFVYEDGKIRIWKKNEGTSYNRLADVLNRSEYFAANHGLEYQFSVRCRRCNRHLTDPVSIELGIGPFCRGAE